MRLYKKGILKAPTPIEYDAVVGELLIRRAKGPKASPGSKEAVRWLRRVNVLLAGALGALRGDELKVISSINSTGHDGAQDYMEEAILR